MSWKLTRTHVRHRKHVLESPQVIWRPSENFTWLFLRKLIFWPRNDPKFDLGPSDPVQIKQWGCHHWKEHQKLLGLVLRMIDLVKIWHVKTLVKGVRENDEKIMIFENWRGSTRSIQDHCEAFLWVPRHHPSAPESVLMTFIFTNFSSPTGRGTAGNQWKTQLLESKPW